MTKSLDDDFVITAIVVDQVGIRRQENAAHAGNGCLAAGMGVVSQQRQDDHQAGFHLGRPLGGLFRDVPERLIDLLKGAF